MKIMISFLFRYFFYTTLVGRYISLDEPKLGRFSKKQLKIIVKKLGIEQNKLLVASKMSQYKSHGNRLMVFSGIISLVAYRELRNEGISHQYATLLIADVVWKLYLSGAKLIWRFVGLIYKEPQKRLNITLRILCKYPFNTDPKGYQYKLYAEMDHLSMDFTRCVVHQFIKSQGNDEEMDFFRNSWCLYDFALPAYLTEGGDYARVHTLSHGDNVCDMKWYARSIKSKKTSLT